MRNVRFDPPALAIAVGATLVWTNHDGFEHTVTPADKAFWGTEGSGDEPSTWLGEGASWSFTFTRPGTYEYYCIPHATRNATGSWVGMTGRIVVEQAAGVDGHGFMVPNATVVPSALAPRLMLPGGDGVVRILLETKEVVAQIADGAAYAFWTFNGTVPGPMLRVREGDLVELTLENAPASMHAHSIDLHAVTGPGGGAGATQVAPGESKSFRFKALNPGIYVYHCASPHIPTHVANGMYGLILVEPADGLPRVDREFYVVQGEFYTAQEVGSKGLLTVDPQKMREERAEYYLFNGRVGSLVGDGALRAAVNDTVRIYFGVGGFVPSSFHLIGEIFDRVYPEGGFPPVHNVQTTLVPGGGATLVEFKAEVPGIYLLVDHWLTHAIDRGAVGQLVVEGSAAPEVFSTGEPSGGTGH